MLRSGRFDVVDWLEGCCQFFFLLVNAKIKALAYFYRTNYVLLNCRRFEMHHIVINLEKQIIFLQLISLLGIRRHLYNAYLYQTYS